MKRAIGYIRRSTDRQEKSLDEQRQEIERFAGDLGLSGVDFFEDDGISGLVLDRPGLNRAIEMCGSTDGEYPVFLTWDVSRLARPKDPLDGVNLIKRIQDTGRELYLVATGRKVGASFADLVMVMAEAYSSGDKLQQLSRNVLRSLNSQANMGHSCGGRGPYGYDRAVYEAGGGLVCTIRDRDGNGKLVTYPEGHTRTIAPGERYSKTSSDYVGLVPGDPIRVRVLRRIFLTYLDGKGVGKIGAELNAEGVPSPGGGRWSSQTVKNILTNPVYTGDFVYNRRTAGKLHRLVDGRAVEKSEGLYAANSEDDWITVPDAHEALIDRDIFERVQALFKERAGSRHNKETLGSSYLLSGVLYCGCCGAKMHGIPARKGKGGMPAYLCSRYNKMGNLECSNNQAAQAELDGFMLKTVMDDICAGLTSDDEEVILKDLEKRFALEQPDIRATERELKDRMREKEQKIDLILTGLSPESIAAADRHIARLAGEKAQCEAELAMLRQANPEPEKMARGALGLLKEFLKAKAEGPLEHLKALVRRMVRKVTLEFDVTRVGKRKVSVLTGGEVEVYTLGSAAMAFSSRVKHGED